MIEQTPLGSTDESREENIAEYLAHEKSDLATEDFSDAGDKKKRRKIFALLAGVVLLLIAIFAYFSYSHGQKSFANEKVTVSIEAPESIESGAEISLTIGYKNENEVALRSGRLEMSFPDNFILSSSDKTISPDGSISYWSIENIPANSTDKIRIFGKLIGNAGDIRDFKATLKYRPANFNSNFETSTTLPVRVASVPVELAISAPAEGIKNDADTALTFTMKNKSTRHFKKAQIEVRLPTTFSYVPSETTATIKADEEKRTYVFEVADLPGGGEKSVRVEGAFKSESEKETVAADLYLLEENGELIKYIETSQELTINRPEVLVSVAVNGYEDYAANKNEELEYRIDFVNQSSAEIRGLTLTSTLNGNFDLDSVQASGGRFSGSEITWSALGVPSLGQLKPGDRGSISFKVRVKDLFPITKESDKDFTLSNQITLKTASKEIVSLTEVSPVKAFLALDAKGYFNDDGRIENGGALPPRAGEKTYYTIHWSLRDLFSATENVRVVASLPPSVRWTGKYIDSKGKAQTGETKTENSESAPDGESVKITEEKVYYNAATNEMVWELPGLKANEGIISSAKEVVFQIEVSPQDGDAGKEMDIVNASNVSGYDPFTKLTVTGSKEKLTTKLPDDFSISDEEAIVRAR